MTLARALLSWLLLLAVAVANGAAREATLRRWFPEPVANRVSVGWGIALLGAAIWLVTRRWALGSRRIAWRLGALWAALTIAFECGMFAARGRSWEQILYEWEIWNGRLWPLVVAFVLVAPPAAFEIERRVRATRPAVAAALGWAVAAWAACGATIGAGRALLGLDAALVVHAVAAPAIAYAATALYRRHPRHLGRWATAALVLAVAAGLDALVVAPLVERSFAMFASPLGTWIPLALIFLGSLAAGRTRDGAAAHGGTGA